MVSFRGMCLAASFSAVALLAAAPANALPSGASAVQLASPGLAQTIAWRGRGWHRGSRGGYGAAIGLGIAGAVIGGAIAAGSPYEDGDYAEGYDGDEGGVARCEAQFRSFDPSSGTYLGYDGVRRPCPFL